MFLYDRSMFDLYDRNLLNLFNPFLNYRYNHNDNEYKVEVDLPGVNQKDLKVTVDGQYLCLNWSRNNVKDSYKFVVDKKYDLNNVKAVLNLGVLSLKIPLAKKEKLELKEVPVTFD